MQPSLAKPSTQRLRHRRALAALVLLAFLAALWPLGRRLAGQLVYREGMALMHRDLESAAIARFERALERIPSDPDVHLALGEASYRRSREMMRPRNALSLALKAQVALETAFALRPVDSEAAWRLAVNSDWLERHWNWLHPGADHPYRPEHWFETALRLRPNGVSVRRDYARLLHRKGERADLARVVRELGRVYPAAYGRLRKERFWSEPVEAAFADGVREALSRAGADDRAGVQRVLAQIAAGGRRWAAAADHLQAALEASLRPPTAWDHLSVGRYRLAAGQYDRAETAFWTALRAADDPARVLSSVYAAYRNEGIPHRFLPFYATFVERYAGGTRAAMVAARAYVDLRMPARAMEVLRQALREKPDPEGYEQLARIAASERDWDAMELAAQRATVLRPGESRYHLLFSRALGAQNKFASAEQAAGFAIRTAPKPDAGLHAYRAGIRSRREDFAGAVADLETAVRLRPDAAAYRKSLDQARRQMSEAK